MAKTADRKLEVARKIHDIVVGEYGLPPDALIFDALTFTLATGDPEWIDSAKETIEGIRLIKAELPGVFTILGVSNVCFGLAREARAVLNSVFLYHCVQAGLDLAIVNPSHACRTPRFRPRSGSWPRTRVQPPTGRAAASHRPLRRRRRHPKDGRESKEIPWRTWRQTSGSTGRSCTGKKEGVETPWTQRVSGNSRSVVLNEVLLPAMKEVGDKFGAGELILPFVLQSAEVMKRAVAHLEKYLERKEGYTKGKVVLATVYGDVHDIGKNLVNTILTNNGYTVYDLGKQVPVNMIIDKAVEVDADAIGLSALLVSTSKQMPLCVQELDKRGLNIPVMIGGAAINRRFGRRTLFVEGEPTALACSTARMPSKGWKTIDALQDPARREGTISTLIAEARGDVFLHPAVEKEVRPGAEAAQRSTVRRDGPVPAAPFYGVRVVRDIPLEEVLALLDLRELYRLQWGGRGSGEQFEATVRDEFEPTLARLKAEAVRDGWLRPQAI